MSFDTPWWGDNSWVYDGVVTSLIYDDGTRSLYVAGTFDRINGGTPCKSIAVRSTEFMPQFRGVPVFGSSWCLLHEGERNFRASSGRDLYQSGLGAAIVKLTYVACSHARRLRYVRTDFQGKIPVPEVL